MRLGGARFSDCTCVLPCEVVMGGVVAWKLLGLPPLHNGLAVLLRVRLWVGMQERVRL